MKLTTRGLLVVLALVCTAGMSAFWQHCIAAMFGESKSPTLSGIVTVA